MPLYHFTYVLLVAASAVTSAIITITAWRNRHISGATPLALLTLGVVVWGCTKILELVSSDLAATLFWANIQFIGIVAVPVAWLVFALEYTGRHSLLSRPVIAALVAEPVFVQLCLWVFEDLQLFRTSVELASHGPYTGLVTTAGPMFWLHAAYSYLLLAMGTGLIVQMVFLSESLYRGQAFGLLIAVLVPWVANGLYLGGVTPTGLDPTIIAFALAGCVMLVTITRHRLFDVVPAARELARDELIENMTDAVVVVNTRDRIVDCNTTAQELFDRDVSELLGQPLTHVPPLDTVLTEEPADGRGGLQTELPIRNGETVRYYDVRVSALERGFESMKGRVISLRDVTEQHQREQRLNVLNRLLRHNLRNELNIVQGNARMLRDVHTDAETQRRAGTIERAVDTMIDRNEKVSRFAHHSSGELQDPVNVTDEIGGIVAAKRRDYPDAEIAYEAPPEAWTDAGSIVTAALDELITNAIKHNDREARTVSVSVEDCRRDRHAVKIRVTDNGPGLPDHEVAPIVRGKETPLEHASGVGLWLVTWIVREADGDLEFTETDDGTTVTITLPRACGVEDASGS